MYIFSNNIFCFDFVYLIISISLLLYPGENHHYPSPGAKKTSAIHVLNFSLTWIYIAIRKWDECNGVHASLLKLFVLPLSICHVLPFSIYLKDLGSIYLKDLGESVNFGGFPFLVNWLILKPPKPSSA